MSQLETNTTSLQTLLDKVNALPEVGSGEDVTEETNTYTSLLTELETAIDELPDAGSGTVETCTVTITGCYQVVYTGLEDGNMVAMVSTGTTNSTSSHTIQVCKGMPIVCVRLYGQTVYGQTGKMEQLSSFSTYYYAFTASTDATIGFITSGSGVD